MKIFWRRLILIILLTTNGLVLTVPIYSANRTNINRAKQLMTQKLYREALDILLVELEQDVFNTEVMNLIRQIQEEKNTVTNQMFAGLESIRAGRTVEAENIIRSLQTYGEFDQSIQDKMALFAVENETLSRRNRFNALVDSAEQDLLEYRISDALSKYKEAMDIFRVAGDTNQEFNSIIISFRELENKTIGLGLDATYLKYSQRRSFDAIIEDVNILQAKYGLWSSHINDLSALILRMESLPENIKQTLTFLAFQSICNKYINSTRRGVHKIGRETLNNTIEESNGYYNRLQERDRSIEFALQKLNEYSDTAYQIAFYQVSESRAVETLGIIESDNVLRRADALDLVVANKLRLPVRIAELEKIKVNNEYLEFKRLSDAREVELALNILRRYDRLISDLRSVLGSAGAEINRFRALSSRPVIAPIYQRFTKLTEEVDEIYTLFYTANENYKDLKITIDQMTLIADRTFRDAVARFNARQYDQSEEMFLQAKERYLEVSALIRSSYVETQLEGINGYFVKIEEIKYLRDIEIANNYMDAARTLFYQENYDRAKQEIDKAKEIYDRYNQTGEYVLSLYERILTALKVKSGSELTLDDPLYNMITELYRQALISFDNRDYQRALSNVNGILLEKPYNRNARVLETRILRMIDINSFNERFEIYFQNAMGKYNAGNYTAALTEFEQLLIFNTRTDQINRYILDCKRRLNIVRTTVTTVDRNEAVRMVARAEQLYIEGKYAEALQSVESGLRIWDEVPRGNTVRTSILGRMGVRPNLLSSANQINFTLAQQAYTNNNFDEAIRLCRQILSSQEDPNVQRLLNRALQRKGQ